MGMEYEVKAEQVVPNVSTVRTKEAQIYFDSSPGQSEHLFNPAELFLSAFAACILKNVERFSERLKFAYNKASIKVHGVREEPPPRLTTIKYELTLYTNESPQRIDLLRRNLEKYGTIYNTVANTCEISGEIIPVNPVDQSDIHTPI